MKRYYKQQYYVSSCSAGWYESGDIISLNEEVQKGDFIYDFCPEKMSVITKCVKASKALFFFETVLSQNPEGDSLDGAFRLVLIENPTKDEKKQATPLFNKSRRMRFVKVTKTVWDMTRIPVLK